KIAGRTGTNDIFITNPDSARYNGYATFSDGTRRYGIPDGSESNPHGGKQTRSTYDHTKDALGTDHMVDNNLTISGGDKQTSFLFSLSRLQQEGVIKNFSDYSKTSVRINADHQLSDWFRISAGVNYIKMNSTRAQQGNNVDGLLLGALRTPPDFDNSNYIGDYTDINGLITTNRHISYRNAYGQNDTPGFSNPLWNINNNKNTSDVDRIIGKIEIGIDPTEWLSITGRVGTDNFTNYELEKFPVYSANYPGGHLSRGWSTEHQFNADLFLKAEKRISQDFRVNGLLGVNYNGRKEDGMFADINNFILPDAPDLLSNALNTNLEANNYTSLQRTYAYYTRAGMDAFHMLFLTLTGRIENASTFGSETKGNFFYPSAELAWQFTRLKFLTKSSVVSFGKLRLTYGEVGIQPGVYQTSTIFEPSVYGDGCAGTLSALAETYGGGYTRSSVQGNSHLRPERKKEVELGIDARFLNDRISMSVTLYSNTSEDVIINLQTPAEIGFSSRYTNAAKIGNRGLELDLAGDIVSRQNFKWNFSLNWSANRNMVVSLAGASAQPVPNSFADNYIVEGQPYGVFYSTDFVKKEPNKYELDRYGFPIVGGSSVVIGNPNPAWQAGIGSTISYKGLSLFLLFNTVYGNDFWDGTKGALYYFGTHADTGHEVVSSTDLRKINGDVIPAGTPFRGQIKDFGGGPVALTQDWYRTSGSTFGGGATSQFIEKGTATRLRELTLSYNLRSPGLTRISKLSSVNFSITARNLILWTQYTGIDPDVNITGANTARGGDYFNNPNTRSILLSIKINY
ncbi:MAG: TonB-dependent receptor, partial [Bacteroidetes bacterium]|nr:TonB-dependent receptor [Bacteroidota bacterium]